MPLPSYTGTLGRKAAAHLLRRATFGPNKQEIDYYSGLTASQAITELFQTTPEPQPPVVPGASVSWVNMPPDINEPEMDQQPYVVRWWFGQMLNTNVPASGRMAFSTREKITFFLHSHFTTIQQVVNNSRSLYFQNVLFRKYAFDGSAGPVFNFRDLAKKICVDNAMLALLDGRLNVKGNPNENYAREFLELFTIGKGLPGQVPVTGVDGDYYYYTEQDVKAAALVFSGYDIDDQFTNIDPDTGLPRGKVKSTGGVLATQHDNTVKQFSARLGSAVVTPNPALMQNNAATEASVLDEISQLVDIIFSQTETPKNICRKIYRFYVYHEVTPDIDSTIIAEMANTFVTGNFKLEPVLRELLSSQHFYDSMDSNTANDNFGAIIKSPVDLVAGTLNFFEYSMPDYLANTASFYAKADYLIKLMNTQGMDLMNAFDVAGYEAYYQFPLYNRLWISANALAERYNFIYSIMSVDNMQDDNIQIDLLAFYAQRFSANASDPDLLVREVASYLFPMSQEGTEISTERLSWFKVQFMKLGQVANQAQPAFWQFSWANRDTNPSSAIDARGMLQDKINAMLQSPEYQLF